LLLDTSSLELFVGRGNEVFTSRIYFDEETLDLWITGEHPNVKRMVVHELKGGNTS
jgi:sucrose-6-phosphate hydrolase SacC (GH32 family)